MDHSGNSNGHDHHEPPNSPNPSADRGLIPRISSPHPAPSPPAQGADWNVNDIDPVTVMKMLCRAVEALASATGDIPPTPPISRPTTPRKDGFLGGGGGSDENARPRSRGSSRPATPVPSEDIKHPGFKSPELGSPEACAHEPAAGLEGEDVGAAAEPVHIQKVAIARKFFSKKAPPIALEQYLLRLQRYCPMSAAVYLAAGSYVHKLAVAEKLVPVTGRTAHRLLLGTLRVAMKALEDLRYPQARFAGVGGVKESELRALEIAVCYLTEFDLQVGPERLHADMCKLQQAAEQGSKVKSRLSDSYQLKLPARFRNRT